jgi:uncharacterized protein YdeI (YjbR/CyaY-like superfamily)
VKEKISFHSAGEWRAWLAANHDKEKEAWLIIHKKASSRPGLRLEQAVEEALGYGWIDGVMHRVDADTFALRFSPRRPGAVWSAANQRRIRRLIAAGRMAESGLAAVRCAKQNGQWRKAELREQGTRLPADLKKALAENPSALRNFRKLPPSHRKQYLWWIESAKKPETRAARIRETVRRAAEKRHIEGKRRK